MTVDQIYRLILYCCAKNRQQGYVSPDDFNQVLMPTAQNSYMDYLLGEYQRYQIQRPIAVVEFGQNERVRQSISPLIYNIVLNINQTTGIAPFPSDHEYNDEMWSLYGLYDIRFIQQDRRNSYVRSVIDPVTENPVYLLRNEGFWFEPVNPYDRDQARLSYVRQPPSIFWGYDLDGNGRPVYNPALSQQPVWGESDLLNIVVRALQLVGVNLQLGVVIQYAQEIKNTGQ